MSQFTIICDQINMLIEAFYPENLNFSGFQGEEIIKTAMKNNRDKTQGCGCEDELEDPEL